jgi:AcrR family transcriptional regulator
MSLSREYLPLEPRDPAAHESHVAGALAALNASGDGSLVAVGRRENDAYSSEIVWSDPKIGVHVFLAIDTDIPSQSVTVSADAQSTFSATNRTETPFTAVVAALRTTLPVVSFDALVAEASAEPHVPGSLARLALTKDARLAEVLPPLVARALRSETVKERDHAAMATHLSGLAKSLQSVLEDALARESDPGVREMLRAVVASVPKVQFRVRETDDGFVFVLEDDEGQWRLHSLPFNSQDEAIAAISAARESATHDALIERGSSPRGLCVFTLLSPEGEPLAMSPEYKSGTVLEKRIAWLKKQIAGAPIAGGA